MFVGSENHLARFAVYNLASVDRRDGYAPSLKATTKTGRTFEFEMALVPASKNEMIVVLGSQTAALRVQATTLEGLHLPELATIAAKLKATTLGFGADPIPAMLSAFGAQSIEDVNRTLRHAFWWLDQALFDEAEVVYRKHYDELAKLLRFCQGFGIVVPNELPEATDAPWGEASGDFGWTAQELLEQAREHLEFDLRRALNNGSLTVTLEVSGDEALRYTQSAALWQEHYGNMWGPFFDK